MRYIISIDGSKVSQQAVSEAVKFAEQMGAELEIVHAASRKPRENRGEHVLESEDEAEKQGRQILKQGENWIDTDVQVEKTLLWGQPEEAVPEYAENEGVDAIFIGHRGLSRKREKMVGSVAKTIIGRTSMPVIVIGSNTT